MNKDNGFNKIWWERGLCPFCKSDNWKARRPIVDMKEVVANHYCRTCDKEWNSIYILKTTVAQDGSYREWSEPLCEDLILLERDKWEYEQQRLEESLL